MRLLANLASVRASSEAETRYLELNCIRPCRHIHDDFAPGMTGVADEPADNEPSGGIDVVFSVGVEHLGGRIFPPSIAIPAR